MLQNCFQFYVERTSCNCFKEGLFFKFSLNLFKPASEILRNLSINKLSQRLFYLLNAKFIFLKAPNFSNPWVKNLNPSLFTWRNLQRKSTSLSLYWKGFNSEKSKEIFCKFSKFSKPSLSDLNPLFVPSNPLQK